MVLQADTTAQSRLAAESKSGSAEHLFALIDLCKLIERHKKFILTRVEPRETIKINRRSLRHTDTKIARCLSDRTQLPGSGSRTRSVAWTDTRSGSRASDAQIF